MQLNYSYGCLALLALDPPQHQEDRHILSCGESRVCVWVTTTGSQSWKACVPPGPSWGHSSGKGKGEPRVIPLGKDELADKRKSGKGVLQI